MMPQEPIISMMQRTMTNLRFVEAHAKDLGPFEVTQLVNSFLAALAHPWEKYKQQLQAISLVDAAKVGWPFLKKELNKDQDPESLGEQLRWVRNAFAHGNIEFLSRHDNEITHLRFWNNNRSGRRTWGTVASVTDMRMFLDKFVELAESLTEADVRYTVTRRPA